MKTESNYRNRTLRWNIRRIAIITILALAATTTASAQLDAELVKVNKLVADSDVSGNSDRAEVLRQAIEKLEAFRDNDPDVRVLISILEVNEALLRVDDGVLDQNVGQAINAKSSTDRQKALDAVIVELLKRVAFTLRNIDPATLTAKEIRSFALFLRSVNTASQRNPGPSSRAQASSSLSTIVGFTEELLKLRDKYDSPESDPVFEQLSVDFRAFEPESGRSSDTETYDFEAPVASGGGATANNDNSITVWDRSSSALEALDEAIEGDVTALDRLKADADAIGEILSPDVYSRAILDAVDDSAVERFAVLNSMRRLLGIGEKSWLEGDWIAVENNLGYKPPNEVGVVLRFKRDPKTGLVSGYLHKSSAQSQKARFEVGELLFKGYTEKHGGSVWDHYAVGGQCLDSDYHYRDDEGEKIWTNAVIKIPKGKDWMDVSCNFWLLRFKKLPK